MPTVLRLTLTAWLVCLSSESTPAQPVWPVLVRPADPSGMRIELAQRLSEAGGSPARILVHRGIEPVAWFRRSDSSEREIFETRLPDAIPTDAVSLQGWAVAPDLTAHFLDSWPVGGEQFGSVCGVGLGGRWAWLALGANDGVKPGDSFWVRSRGQPMARLQVRSVEPELSFCRVQSLVADSPINIGDRAARWPTPAEQRRGDTRTAVSFVEDAGNTRLIWAPIAPRCTTLAEPRIDFFRDGVYLAHGIVEREDDRFWYVRLFPRMSAAEIRVGDVADVRTQADVESQRFSVRIFEKSPEGFLLNAGEIDDLELGAVGAVYRGGVAVIPIVVRKLQRTFALVQTTDPALADAPAVGDEVRFGPPAVHSGQMVGLVELVVDETAFVARLAGVAPLQTPLAIRRGNDTVGVAILLETAGNRAMGIAFPSGESAALMAGMRLEQDPGAR